MTRELVTPVTEAQLPKSLHRVDFSGCNRLQQLLLALAESYSNVRNALLNDLPEQWGHFNERCIIRVVEPGLYCDAIVWLQQEVLRYVVNNDGTI